MDFWKIPLKTVKSSPNVIVQNIAKGTTDPRVEFSLPNFKQVKNLDQASISKSQPNIGISTEHKLQNFDQIKLWISTSIQRHNLYKTSAGKY